MLKKINLKLCLILTIAVGTPAIAFDLEDYATTFRATRDAYLKSLNELKLASGPYAAAEEAYVSATLRYQASIGSADEIRVAVDRVKSKRECIKQYRALRDEYYTTIVGYKIAGRYSEDPNDNPDDSLLSDPSRTELATLDALEKAHNEFVLAGPPHASALEGYRSAVLVYTSMLKIPSPSADFQEENILKQK